MADLPASLFKLANDYAYFIELAGRGTLGTAYPVEGHVSCTLDYVETIIHDSSKPRWQDQIAGYPVAAQT